MTNRIRRVMVMLPQPFPLKGTDRPVPLGHYEVTTEEEPLGDLMEPAYRRIAASIYVPQPPGRIGIGEIIAIDTPELDALLAYAVPAGTA
jgi:hypothetical protein